MVYLYYYLRARWGDLVPKASGVGNDYNSYRVKKVGNFVGLFSSWETSLLQNSVK